MKARHIFAILGIVAGAVAASGVIDYTSVHATDGYDEGIRLNFQVDEVLTVGLSSTALTIPELIPGTSAVSNYITLTTQTNNMSGCILLADVGDGNTYNSTDLVGNGSTFASLAANADISTLSDNTWGYSASYDSGSTWTSYSGLPLYGTSSKQLTAVSGMGADTMRFRIAAKASDAQTSGEYRNVINFSVVSQVNPLYMQNADEWINSYLVGQQFTVLDERDNQTYRIAKLSANELWMTTNLNLAGGTTITSADSNVATSYTLPAATSANANTGIPANGATITGVINAPNTICDTNKACFSYYSYEVATAGTMTEEITGDATYDICPKGWRMLTGAEYTSMLTTYDTAAKLAASPIKLVYNGYFEGATNNTIKNNGYYWSSTLISNTQAKTLNVVSGGNGSVAENGRSIMAGVRCKYIGANS